MKNLESNAIYFRILRLQRSPHNVFHFSSFRFSIQCYSCLRRDKVHDVLEIESRHNVEPLIDFRIYVK